MTYGWDAANRLISQVMPPLQSGSGARVLSYLYRYDDLLHQKVGPRGTETLTWDGADPLFWQRSQDGLFQPVVHGNSAIRSVGTGSGGGALANHLHLDAQANVQSTTDAAQAVSQDVAWDLFGDVTLGQSKSNPLDYGGGMGYWNDYDTPLTYVRARWLDPNTGRWLSRDPLETEHPYAYAGSSPMLYADPSGMQSQDVDLMGHPLHGRRKKHHPDNDLMAPPHAVSGRQTQAPHLADIDWSIVLWEGAKKLALGVGVAAGFGFVFATAPAWVSGALVVGGTVLLSAAVISAVHERLNGAKSMHEPLSIPLRIVAGVGDVVGVTPILEGAAGYEFFTGRQFNTQERSEKLSEWGTTASFLLGPRAFNVGEQSGYLVRQPGLLSGGISGLPNAWQKAGTAANVARVIRINPTSTAVIAGIDYNGANGNQGRGIVGSISRIVTKEVMVARFKLIVMGPEGSIGPEEQELAKSFGKSVLKNTVASRLFEAMQKRGALIVLSTQLPPIEAGLQVAGQADPLMNKGGAFNLIIYVKAHRSISGLIDTFVHETGHVIYETRSSGQRRLGASSTNSQSSELVARVLEEQHKLGTKVSKSRVEAIKKDISLDPYYGQFKR